MMMIWEMMKAQLQSQKGQGMVEYGLIIAFVAVVAAVGVGTLGGNVNDLFTGIKISK
jgi:pilus assembly protein Flp/PilA